MTLIGIRIRELLKKRIKLLEETESLILNLKIEFKYRSDILPDVLQRISALTVCNNLSFLTECCNSVKRGSDFPTAWKTALENSREPYIREEKSRLVSLGEILGTTDTESQLSMLSLYGEYIRGYLVNARRSEEKYGRLCSAVGFMLGFAVFVLVL